MPDEDKVADATWIAVIGKALCYFALHTANEKKPFETVNDRVTFLENLGLPLAAAAEVAGTSKASVVELRRVQKGRKNGKKKSKPRRRS